MQLLEQPPLMEKKQNLFQRLFFKIAFQIFNDFYGMHVYPSINGILLKEKMLTGLQVSLVLN